MDTKILAQAVSNGILATGRVPDPVMSLFLGYLDNRLNGNLDRLAFVNSDEARLNGENILSKLYKEPSLRLDFGLESFPNRCFFEEEEEFLKFLYFASLLQLTEELKMPSSVICEAIAITISDDLGRFSGDARSLNDLKLRLMASIGPVICALESVLSEDKV